MAPAAKIGIGIGIAIGLLWGAGPAKAADPGAAVPAPASPAGAGQRDALVRIQRLVASLRKAVAAGEKDNGQASRVLNRRLDEIARQVDDALKTLPGRDLQSPPVEGKLKLTIENFSRFVQQLGEKVFGDVENTARELTDEAQKIQ
jgi:hypothetical protein